MSNDRVKRFAQRLLISTCLTVGASVAAQAGIVSEGTDFSNTLGTPTVLDPGSTGFSGFVSSGDGADIVQFSGLTPGTLTFNLTASTPSFIFYEFFDSGANFLAGAGGTTPSLAVTVPANGILTAEVGWEGPAEASTSYTLSFDAAAVPEPGTIGGVGLGLAGAALAALRRKKQ